MRFRKPAMYSFVVVTCLIAAPVLWQQAVAAAADPDGNLAAWASVILNDDACLSCHDDRDELTIADEDGEIRPLLSIQKIKYLRSVHGDMACVDCHREIIGSKTPHEKGIEPKPNCVNCHETLWENAKQQDLTQKKARLGIVVENIEAYKNSFHARSSSKNKHGVKAYCEDCHDTHQFNVPSQGTSKRSNWHLTVPSICGKCHEDSLEEYLVSVHGIEATEEHNPKAAVCVDCHTSHGISKTTKEPFKLLVTKQCGSCHEEEFETYRDTYHGQVNTLGYDFTAKCFDCHGSHEVFPVDNPKSMAHPDNRLETCQECHDGKHMMKATAGFVTFGPHANTHDPERYPQMWITSIFMEGLLLFVFIYFWAHSLLWWVRELKDRSHQKTQQRIRTDELLQGENLHVKRFGLIWRIGHLLIALSVMTLVLTGMALYYSYADWAPFIIDLLGGPLMAGLIHRIAAIVLMGIFFLHLIIVIVKIVRQGKSFRWFGPDSLVPNWQDLKDAKNMFLWFFHKGPRPMFDRWCYWEKFDYWAVFWGMAVIGTSGIMLAFADITASIFPGWVFNVITLIHGEEAFLATVFLFTVHFFNNHFRPEKQPPPDVTMFTGTLSIEEFRRDHRLQYDRLVETGELDKYLVSAPSRPMTIGSRILGLVLLTIGLTLLIVVAIGFFGGYTPGV